MWEDFTRNHSKDYKHLVMYKYVFDKTCFSALSNF